MAESKDSRREINSLIDSLSKRIKIEKAIVFGSMGRGNWDEGSDIDLVIVSPDFQGKRFRERAVGLYRFYNLNRPVDLICLTPEEFEKMKDRPTIAKQAIDEGTVVRDSKARR